jgi:FKBP-type peptidyl-prolyl cis-trans isomerase
MAKAIAPVRSSFVLLLLGTFLLTLALVVRSHLLMGKIRDKPMSAAMRETLGAQINQLTIQEERTIEQNFPGARQNKSGLRQIVRAPGDGPVPRPGQTVTVACEGRRLLDAEAKPFYNSRTSGESLSFIVGANRWPISAPIAWEEAFLTMKKGEKRTLIIPWWLAYGIEGSPPVIPPRASLVFEVEMLDIR